MKRMVGRNVRIAREALGYGPSDFGRLIGLSPQQMTAIENGKAYPPEPAVVRACDEFGLSADWFYRGIKSGTAEAVAAKLREIESNEPPLA